MSGTAIVVSGLPASGKSTVAARLARVLAFDFLDKDDFLERLFDDPAYAGSTRQQLSRLGDVHFQAAASACHRVVLVSHWRPVGVAGDSGTPSDWLLQSFASRVELHCHCPPAVAARRFTQRSRHAGHRDSDQSAEDVLPWLMRFSSWYPLGVGPSVTVQSAQQVEIQPLLEQLRPLLGNRSD